MIRIKRKLFFIITGVLLCTLQGKIFLRVVSNDDTRSEKDLRKNDRSHHKKSSDINTHVLDELSKETQEPEHTDSPPHIIFFLADDLGWYDVAYHGSEIKTPNIDFLANAGIKLENYYVMPTCTPSRGQLLTGRYQIHTGLQHRFIVPCSVTCLPSDTPTLPEKLKEAGYATHMVGKWHLGFSRQNCTPTYKGFNTFLGYYLGHEDYYTHMQYGYDFNDRTENGEDRPTEHFTGQYSTHIYTQRVQEITQNHVKYKNTKPLFTYVAYQAVHFPLQVPELYTKQYMHIKDVNRRTYAGMVTAMDESIGNITNTFKSLGLWDNTLMVFSSDNGGHPLYGGYNWPLRGEKNSLYEGGIKAAGFVAGGLVANRSGTVNKDLIDISDWFPTFVNRARGSLKGLQLDGLDMWDALSKGSQGPRSELLHNIDPLSTRIGERYPNSPFDTRKSAAIRVGNYKLITGNPGNGTWFSPDPDKAVPMPDEGEKNVWLFDITNDPTEQTDLSQEMPEVVMKMLSRLAEHNATAVPSRFTGNDPLGDPSLHNMKWVPWIE